MGEVMDTLALVQGSDEWRAARVGSLGASQVADALAKIKTGWGAGRANVMAALIADRITGQPTETYVSPAMAHGTATEEEARNAYAFRYDAEIVQVGLVRHPTIKGAHASPDGLVGDSGLLEVKCPNVATHLDTLLGQNVPGRYVTQIQFQLACTGRQWCDFVSYDNRLPEEMRLYCRRVHRDDGVISYLETEVTAFLAEVDAKIASLTALYGRREAA